MRNKKTRMICAIVLFLCSTIVYGQKKGYVVVGQVIDSLTKESVPYVTIKVVTSENKKTPISLLASNEDGKFEAKIKNSGTYLFQMQSLGKISIEKKVSLVGDSKFLNLGKVYMADDNQEIGEVTVFAQKPLVKVDIDKLSYNMEEDPEATTNNTLEMLRKVPLVTVDGEDNIQLKGSSNYKIYLNGKPSNMIDSNPAQVLRSMPANTIKNIEVITDPGAKYDAEGVGGIINIITKTKAMQGYTASINTSVSSTGDLGSGGFFSTKVGKLGFTGNYNYYNTNRPWTDSYMLRENLQNGLVTNTMEQNGRSKHSGPFQYGRLEASYELDSLNLISLGGNLYGGNSKNTTESMIQITEGGLEMMKYSQNARNEAERGSVDLNLDYQHQTMKKDELLTFSYRFSNVPNNSKSNTEYDYLPDLEKPITKEDTLAYEKYYLQRNINDAFTEEHTGQVDYTTPLGKGHTIEGGLKYIYRLSKSSTDREVSYPHLSENNSDWMPQTSDLDEFSHRQHIYSAYLGYRLKLASKWGIKSGLRAEGTSLKVSYDKNDERNFETNYFDVVPNITVSFMPKMGKQWRLGYNMRIQRPGIWYLNPYINNSDPKNISYGNPDLNSEKSHSFNFSFNKFSQKFSVNASLSYQFVNNAIERYTFFDEKNPDVSQTTYDNIGRRQKTSLFVYMNWTPSRLLRFYMNGSVDYNDYKSNISNMNNSGFSQSFFGGGQLTFPKDFSINFFSGYFGSRITLQGSSKGLFFNGFGVTKSLMKKKLNISLFMENPFKKDHKFESNTASEAFRMQNINYFPGQRLRLRVSYRFGELKARIKKISRGISNDDVKQSESQNGTGSGEPTAN